MSGKKGLHQEVQDYYGKTLQTSTDLKTNACCTVQSFPDHIKKAMAQIHDEVHSKYYGCGLAIPENLDGLAVLDLGSGSGRDAYILSKLVGEKGKVVGVDMTPEQLDVARRHQDYHATTFGHGESNTEFIHGHIEHLDQCGLKDESFDVAVSNCVINLAKDKEAVLRETYRVLKEGGELYFSDVYADRRIPKHLIDDPVLYGECLSGALYWNDFLTLAKKVGFIDPRTIKSIPITIENKEIEKKVGSIKFYSVTYRLYKINSLESDCEDYGQAVAYKGTLKECPNAFELDDHHLFEKGKVISVCGNTFDMLAATRFKNHFTFYGDQETHYGIFEGCGGAAPFNTGNTSTPETGACC